MTNDQIEKLYKKTLSPLVIEKDIEYYSAVNAKLLDLKRLLIELKVDDSILRKSDAFRKTIMTILREYYKGNIAFAQTKMINQIKAICNNDKNAANEINNCSIFDGDPGDVPFFRARLDADEDGFEAKDMGVIPFGLRTKCSTERFSMPGLPCLYIGNTSYVCWLEMGKPADYRFNVSVVWVDRTQMVFDLTVSLVSLFDRNDKGNIIISEGITDGLVKRVMLAVCSSFRVKEQGRLFKSEYIIPQLIMLACQKYGLAGVAYISSKISNVGIYGVCAANVALYAKYPNNTFKEKIEKTELDDHIEIDDAFNYAMFKQFTEPEPIKQVLWIERCKWIKNIEIHGQQFPYRETEFFGFDKFLVCHWLDKKNDKL